MSTETPTSKPSPTPNPVSNAPSSQLKPQHVVLSATTHVDKPRPTTELAATNIDKPLPPGDHSAILAAANAKPENLQSLLEDLTSPDSVRRVTAAGALGRLAGVAAVLPLIAALNDSDADVAREAAVSLGLLRNDAAVEPLITVVNNFDGYFHSVVRIAATTSLGQLRDPRAVVPLLNAIRDHIAEVSTQAIRALANLPDPRGLPALLEVVRNEHNFFLATTRRAAILGLAKIGGTQADCELRFVAANEWEDAIVRAAAIEAMRGGASSTAGA
jgi:HEAT repeat protein